MRWQFLLAFLSLALVLALLTFQVQTASLCTVTVPATGGTVTEGIVGAPVYLNPLLSDANPVDRELVGLIFDGLTRYNESGELEPALAESWQVAEDGRSLQFTLRQDLAWHDGQPVTANDVAFTYGLIQDEAFPGPAALHQLWQAVTITVTDDHTLTFTLDEPYSPFLEATTRGILPAHRWQGVTAVSLPDHTLNRNPIGSGPFVVEADQEWQRTRRLRLTPHPDHWRQGTQVAGLEFRFYPDEETLLQAFANGEIYALNHITPSLLPQVAALPGVRLFTAPTDRYTALFFNLTATANPAWRPVEMRQALAYGLDRERLVDETLSGQGVALDGPYLPTSWAYNPNTLTPYSAQPITATTLLAANGWNLPEGATLRQKDGESLTLQLLALDTPTQRLLAEAIGEQWSALGIGVQLSRAGSLSELRQQLGERQFDVVLVDVRPPRDPDLYDFWSQEAIVRGQNFAGWNNRRASEALEQARQTWGEANRRPFYDTFLRLYDTDLPALTLFQHVYVYGLSSEVHEAEIGRIYHPRDRYKTMADWFLLYRDVTVSCPTDHSE
ncbi:MAG: peptide ABC transporter substrate-binding protein [Chloroflexota bacterium]